MPLCSGGGGGGGGGGHNVLPNALKPSSSRMAGQRGDEKASDFEPFNQRRDHDVAKMAFATFSSGESAKAEARYGCLRDVYATNAGYSSINDNWRHRFKAGETTTEEERVSKTRGHRVSGDDVETVRIYYEGGVRTYKTLLSAARTFRCWNRNVGGAAGEATRKCTRTPYIHTEEQLEAATQMLKEKREKSRTRRTRGDKNSQIYAERRRRLTFAHRGKRRSKNRS